MAPNVGLGTEGPVQRGWALWLISVVGVLISALFVAARVLQRLLKTTGLGLDDYTIIAALISSGFLSLVEIEAVVHGYGHHYKTLPPATAITARKWFFAANVMYKVVLLFSKMSIVFLYYRIFAVSKGWFRTACHIAQTWVITANMAFIIATIFQCKPISGFWNKKIHSVCFQNEPFWVSYAVVQGFTDVVLLVLPIRQVFTLSMQKIEKFGLSLVFATGLFVTFCTIFRATTLAASAKDTDPTWGPIPATNWAVIEANASIVCTCLPMLRHPFVKLLGPMLPTRNSRSGSKPQSYRLSSRGHSSRKANQRSALESKGSAAADMSAARESEERIISEFELGQQVRRNKFGGILVKKDVSVRSERQQTGIAKHADYKSDAESANEDKKSASSTFLHV